MNWEQKLQALSAIGSDISLNMRKPGDWYVDHRGVDTKEVEGSCCIVGRYGNGVTPAAAVEDHWFRLTEEQPLAYLVVSGLGGARRYVRWNGFMWQDVPR